MSGFKLNEMYKTVSGYDARVVCVDANVTVNGCLCNLVAILTGKNAAGLLISPASYIYSDAGKLGGTGNAAFDLISNEPNAEEAKLIQEIGDYCERNAANREEQLLKIIRQLRRK